MACRQVREKVSKIRHYISPVPPETPTEPIYTKSGKEEYFQRIITVSKFHDNQATSFDSVGSNFPILYRKVKSPLTPNYVASDEKNVNDYVWNILAIAYG